MQKECAIHHAKPAAPPKPVFEKPKPVFEKPFLAWHFASSESEFTVGDGVTVKHDGPLMVCFSGLHASHTIIKAAVSCHDLDHDNHTRNLLCRVEMSGEYDSTGYEIDVELCGKFVARERKILWRVTAEQLVAFFKRNFSAKNVVRWTDYSEVVTDCISGNDALRKYALQEIDYDWSQEKREDDYRFARSSGWALRRVPLMASNSNTKILKDLARNACRSYVRAAGLPERRHGDEQYPIVTTAKNMFDFLNRLGEFEAFFFDEGTNIQQDKIISSFEQKLEAEFGTIS